MRRTGRREGGSYAEAWILFAGLVCLSPSVAMAGDGRPSPVSPGGVGVATQIAVSCPTFSWGGGDGANGYEVALYRVSVNGTLGTALELTVAGDARSWTPPTSQCPESGGTYAWAVRAVSEEGKGSWSELMLFETAGRPSEDEVRQALAVLRRHLETEAGQPAEGDRTQAAHRPETPPTAPSDATGTEQRRARRALTADTVNGPSAVVAAAAVPVLGDASLSLQGQLHLSADGAVFKDGELFLWDDSTQNTALGNLALANTTGNGNTAFGALTLFDNTTGYDNVALGKQAMTNNTEGYRNTAVGSAALANNTTGDSNIAVGASALRLNTSGYGNTAVGTSAMRYNTTGKRNTANGYGALLANTTGYNNTATGLGALLYNTTGSRNTAVGRAAGLNWITGSYNIALGVGASGTSYSETGTIRIGGNDLQTQTFIEGISATVVSGVNVMIDSNDQLGVAASSARFKQDVHDLEGVSDRLLGLRPVSFRYKKEAADSSEGVDPNPTEYGLIAEEVAEVFPELVLRDDEGRPYTVRYHLLTPLLLGEVQGLEKENEHRKSEVDGLRQQVVGQRKVAADLRRRLEELERDR